VVSKVRVSHVVSRTKHEVLPGQSSEQSILSQDSGINLSSQGFSSNEHDLSPDNV